MRILLLYILFQCIQLVAVAQDKQELQKQNALLKNELAALQKELNVVSSGKSKSLASLRVIQDKIDVRTKLINNISNEVNLLDKDLTKTQRQVNSLNAKLDTLKEAYAKSIVYAYKNRNNYDFLTFIFSAKNFNDALKRMQYLKEYRNYRARQTDEIKKYKDILLGRKKELDGQKKEKSNVLQNQSSEINNLAGERTNLDNSVKELSGKENALASLITKQRKKQAKVTSIIAALNKREELVRKKAAAEEKKRKDAAIAAAAKEAKLEQARIAAANATSKTKTTSPSGTKPNTTTTKGSPSTKVTINKPDIPKPIVEEPEYTVAEVNANASFEQNKGRMNYPLQGGYIRTRFGLQKLGTVQWNNESTTFESNSPGATVVAIFNGVVKSVDVDDDTKTVFISHGKYISVYGNMSSSNVTVGQTVTAGQVIGRCAVSEENPGKGLLELMMFRDNRIENPERWIRR